jgi:hypothetical protein
MLATRQRSRRCWLAPLLRGGQPAARDPLGRTRDQRASLDGPPTHCAPPGGRRGSACPVLDHHMPGRARRCRPSPGGERGDRVDAGTPPARPGSARRARPPPERPLRPRAASATRPTSDPSLAPRPPAPASIRPSASNADPAIYREDPSSESGETDLPISQWPSGRPAKHRPGACDRLARREHPCAHPPPTRSQHAGASGRHARSG